MSRVFSLATLLLLMSCGSSVSPFVGLDGAWQWQFNENPAGSGITLNLFTSGETVSGSGTICGVGPACRPGSVTIEGRRTGIAVQLTLRGDSSYVAAYSGYLVSLNELKGRWLVGADSSTVILFRR